MLYSLVFFLAFSLYLLYDLNSVVWKNRIIHKSFFIGTFILFFTTVAMVYDSMDDKRLIPHLNIGINFYTFLILTLAGIFALLLVYSLFFEIPFKKTYLDKYYSQNIAHNECEQRTKKPKAYKQGTYALCRHPGVLWFAGLYLCICLSFPTNTVILNSILLVILDVAYVAFQDKWTFVRTFDDYKVYKKTTPFLVPNVGSIRSCLQSIKSMKG